MAICTTDFRFIWKIKTYSPALISCWFYCFINTLTKLLKSLSALMSFVLISYNFYWINAPQQNLTNTFAYILYTYVCMYTCVVNILFCLAQQHTKIMPSNLNLVPADERLNIMRVMIVKLSCEQEKNTLWLQIKNSSIFFTLS